MPRGCLPQPSCYVMAGGAGPQRPTNVGNVVDRHTLVELELFIRPCPSDALLAAISVRNISRGSNNFTEHGQVINDIE